MFIGEMRMKELIQKKLFTYAHTPVGPLPTPFMFYISATPKSNNFPLFQIYLFSESIQKIILKFETFIEPRFRTPLSPLF